MRHLIDILFLIFFFVSTISLYKLWGKKTSASAKHLPAQIKLALQHVKNILSTPARARGAEQWGAATPVVQLGGPAPPPQPAVSRDSAAWQQPIQSNDLIWGSNAAPGSFGFTYQPPEGEIPDFGVKAKWAAAGG